MKKHIILNGSNLTIIKQIKYLINWYLLARFGAEKELYWARGQNFDMFVDVGANHGLFSVALRKVCKELIIIEPLKQNMEILRRVTFPIKHKCSYFRVALSNETGSATMIASDINKKSTRSKIGTGRETANFVEEVPVSTLDGLLKSYDINNTKVLIKVDVEGHESKVLDGAKKSLSYDVTWIVEIEQEQNENYQNVFATFEENGYQCFVVERQSDTLNAFNYRLQKAQFINYIFMKKCTD